MYLPSDFFESRKIEYYENFDLSAISSFKIGGPAKYAVYPKNEEELLSVVNFSKESEIRFEIIGNATNVLFSDNGYDGIIIFTKKMNKISIRDNRIHAECGAKLGALSVLAKNNFLSGLEFAHGIPGTLGGAITMNAGAYGNQMSNVLKNSRLYDISKNTVEILSSDAHMFEYRKSIFSKNKNLICLSSELELSKGDPLEIEKVMQINSEKRKSSQPLDFPNGGSYFKRPEGLFAAKLIDDCSLKGYRIGGAAVSMKHAGFIINLGDATSSDVLALEEHIKRVVFEKFGVMLECEVKYIK